MSDRLRVVKHFVLDMDGTIYLGGALFPTTLPFLQTLAELGIGHTFLTNNNSLSRADYVRKLAGLGVAADDNQVYSSAHATIHYLQTEAPQARRLFVVGTPALLGEFAAAGYDCVDSDPDALVVGFDTALPYDRLCRASYLAAQGLPYVATHPDFVCPTDQPTVLPDCGAVCALIKAAVGREPDAVPGKPNGAMLHGIRQRHGLTPAEVAVVGDRIYTDVRMGRDAGALAILTLTGEAGEEDVSRAAPEARPDLVIRGLDSLAEQLRAAHQTA
ncbi:Ribonucleotide monophosphatase NagD [Posidoniimonas polymericola]|uniref:Ribonucleotide monophosphatase NagD n=1 Tax=Posidoniimonas polymericola TaxID=2528002 RepID=A0A5C5YTZ7_9BACT|nr:HAD-IIA family hydrolase [Posidoniimonas polymericola]TWT78226.1 Ribonucleotide monophosphatase NagD [Posidoniimonas polymericola]